MMKGLTDWLFAFIIVAVAACAVGATVDDESNYCSSEETCKVIDEKVKCVNISFIDEVCGTATFNYRTMETRVRITVQNETLLNVSLNERHCVDLTSIVPIRIPALVKKIFSRVLSVCAWSKLRTEGSSPMMHCVYGKIILGCVKKKICLVDKQFEIGCWERETD